MNNFKLTIEYDGTEFKGWQRLGKGENTIQGKIETVLAKMTDEAIEIVGASRTDAGVHALAQVASFKTGAAVTAGEVKTYLNTYLPKSISIADAVAASDRFHARYHAKNKTYLYRVWNQPHGNPFLRKYSMHVPQALDLAAIRTASRHFLGEHDFAVYANAKSNKKDTVRKIDLLDVSAEAGMVLFRISGNGFLYNMVRKIVGTLLEVGQGEKKAEDIPVILASSERQLTGGMAEACGLFLEKVEY